jgi:hypothetical protein
MKRSSLLCLIFLLFFSLGHRSQTTDDGISKIYLYGSTLIRTSPGKDIRFFDISDPKSPSHVGTIMIEGNNDVAVKSRYLYADRDHDLVIYDISDVSRPVEVGLFRDLFTFTLADLNRQEFFIDEGDGGFSGCGGCGEDRMTEPVAVRRSSSFDNSSGGNVIEASGASGDVTRNGKAGSLSRFAVVGNFLYCIDHNSMKVLDISNPKEPILKNTVAVGWEIETLFPYKDKLFIGGRTGMYIYDATDKANPRYISEFRHFRNCDPVVVEGNMAYVTLRGGTRCGGNNNQLDILDVSDLENPRHLMTVPMNGPYGLAVRDGVVLVCDGTAGLVILDANDPQNPKRIGSIGNLNVQDVILDGDLLVVTAVEGFYLYNVSNIGSPELFSRLSF